MSGGKRVHFIGICGAGMSAVAKLMRDRGWEVTGSDAEFYPPVSDFVKRLGLDCRTPHDPANIPPNVDRIVIGKHAKLRPDSNAEVAEAFARKDRGETETLSFPEVIRELTRDTHNIVVAGSFGKSTTTAIIAWILQQARKEPGYLIGAVPLGWDSTASLGEGRWFVLEGDEYPSSNWDNTSKFLYYNAGTVVLTSGEYDHFNEFKTEDSYVDRYRQLVRSIPSDGLLLACSDGAHVAEIAREASCRIVTYSARSSDADWTARTRNRANTDNRDVPRHIEARQSNGCGENTPQSTWFELLRHGEHVIDLQMQLFGGHNIENAVGAVATLIELGAVTRQEARAGLASFPGLRRRLESKTTRSSIIVYEDLSSSFPKAVACLRAVRERHRDARITAVFQPHTFSFRSRRALQWYPGMFDAADSVIVFSPPRLQGLSSSEELSHEEILAAIRNGNSCPILPAASSDEVISQLESRLKPDDVIVLMTSGGMGGAIESVVKLVESKFAA